MHYGLHVTLSRATSFDNGRVDVAGENGKKLECDLEGGIVIPEVTRNVNMDPSRE